MEVLVTFVSTREDKTIMDILAQIAAEYSVQRPVNNDTSSMYSAGFRKLFTNKLIRGAAKTVEFIGEDVANSVFAMLRPFLGNKINEYLVNNDIGAFVSVEQIVKEYEKMKITIEVSQIDYEGIINRYLPDILASLREKDPDNYLWKVYDVIRDAQPAVVKAVLDSISNAKKEAIIELMILQHKKSLGDKISELLAAQNIGISVDDICVSADRKGVPL